MLLGQTVNAYRHGDVDFAELLRRVDAVDGLERLRFTTSHPEHVGTAAGGRAARPAEAVPVPAPARPVGLRPDPGLDAARLHARPVPRHGRALAEPRAGPGALQRRHRRLPGRDGGGLPGHRRPRRGRRFRRPVRVHVFAAAGHERAAARRRRPGRREVAAPAGANQAQQRRQGARNAPRRGELEQRPGRHRGRPRAAGGADTALPDRAPRRARRRGSAGSSRPRSPAAAPTR